MLYREPKLLKDDTRLRLRPRRSSVSVLYREPKLLKDLVRDAAIAAIISFSALP